MAIVPVTHVPLSEAGIRELLLAIDLLELSGDEVRMAQASLEQGLKELEKRASYAEKGG
jgi:hypothetical protein